MNDKIYPVPKSIAERALCDKSQYESMYEASVSNPDAFWGEHASMVSWFKAPTKVKNTLFSKDEVSIKWFEDGQLNASYNCIDRHLPEFADKPAILWEGDSPEHSQTITYQELHDEVCKLANGLKKLGVTKGDRVAIYMPMVPHVGVCAYWCHSQCHFRWFLT